MNAPQTPYLETVRSAFALLKRPTRPDDLLALHLPIAGAEGACLAPVCELHAADPALVAALAEWRERNMWVYPNQFQVTLAGTADWLRRLVLDAPDRVLFLVLDAARVPVGHLGFAQALNEAREMKVDNVMRGPRNCLPGVMSRALRAALQWAERTLGVRRFHLPVFRDNEHAIHFYRRLGFREDGLIPLRRHVEGARISFRSLAPDDHAAPDRYHLRLICTPTGAMDDAGGAHAA
jgi:RimJ/RimL family protein N-acetyltransferase